MTPTLVTTRRILDEVSNPDELFASPEAAYSRHPMQTEIWSFISNMYKEIPPQAQTKLRDDFEKFQRPFTKVFHDKGGQLMTGTDSLMPRLGTRLCCAPELQELVDIGLTPYEALRASTTIPYEYLGESKDAGTIEVGKRPDLLLVDANPLEDISAASKIAGVMMRGRWIDGEEIDRRMRKISGRPAGSSAPRRVMRSLAKWRFETCALSTHCRRGNGSWHRWHRGDGPEGR